MGLTVRASGAQKADNDNESEEEISAPEDLMREHGVLNRILLIHEEGIRRLRVGKKISPEVFHKAPLAVEDYHEKLEERHIFPEFEKRKTLPDLSNLLQQHDAGRRLTDIVLRNAADQFGKPDSGNRIIRSCEAFIRMYRPHAAIVCTSK